LGAAQTDICAHSIENARAIIMFASRLYPTNAYSNVQVETSVNGADRHQLISLLLDGALSSIASAASAIERDDAGAKRRAISRAVGIVDEGLRSALDHDAGGQVAATLHSLYSYVVVRLTQANVNNDFGMLRECSSLLQPVRDAWAAIRPQRIAA
jgi:flagellar protein FliS